MAEAAKTTQQPTAPPVTAMMANGGDMVSGFGSAREATALHLQQLAHEQRELGSQLQDVTCRSLGVNQQLADSVILGKWFNGSDSESGTTLEVEQMRQALAVSEAQGHSQREAIERLEAEINNLQRQLHRAMASNSGNTSATTDKNAAAALQEDLGRSQRMVRTKETLISAMMIELDSVKSQLSEAQAEKERLAEQCQQMSGPLASAFRLPLAARFTQIDEIAVSSIEASLEQVEEDEEADLSPSGGGGDVEGSEKTDKSAADMTEQELRTALKKKKKQMAEVVKINQAWERQYNKVSKELEMLKASQEKKEGREDRDRAHSHAKKKGRHHRSERVDAEISELQAELDASRREVTNYQERNRALERKLREKHRSLMEETEQRQVLLAEKESLEAHMSGAGPETKQEKKELQTQLDALRKELHTSMNSETRIREELATSQATVETLRQQAKLLTEDVNREQRDKQRIEQQLKSMQAQLQQLVHGAVQFMGPAGQPGRGPPMAFSGERAEIDNNQLVPEARHLETVYHTAAAAGGTSTEQAIEYVCKKCKKPFDDRSKLMEHLNVCPK